jgi:hypothetical protein
MRPKHFPILCPDVYAFSSDHYRQQEFLTAVLFTRLFVSSLARGTTLGSSSIQRLTTLNTVFLRGNYNILFCYYTN